MVEHEENKTDYADVHEIALGIRRAHLKRPLDTDFIELSDAPFPSIARDDIETAKSDFELFQQENALHERVDSLSDRLHAFHLNNFCKKYLTSGYSQLLMNQAVQVCLHEERFEELEEFLRDIARGGFDSAWKKFNKSRSGTLLGHVWVGLLAAFEIAIFLLALNACEHGFQVLVISALGFIYATVLFAVESAGRYQVSQFFSINYGATRMRFLLKDKILNRNMVNEAQDDFIKANQKASVRHYISTTKTIIIELIAVLAVLATVL